MKNVREHPLGPAPNAPLYHRACLLSGEGAAGRAVVIQEVQLDPKTKIVDRRWIVRTDDVRRTKHLHVTCLTLTGACTQESKTLIRLQVLRHAMSNGRLCHRTVDLAWRNDYLLVVSARG